MKKFLFIICSFVLYACGSSGVDEIGLLEQKLAQCAEINNAQNKVNEENDQLLAGISSSIKAVDLAEDSLFDAIDIKEEKKYILKRIALVDSMMTVSNDKIKALENKLAKNNHQPQGLVAALKQMKKELEEKKTEILALKEQVTQLEGTVSTQKLTIARQKKTLVKTHKKLIEKEGELIKESNKTLTAQKQARQERFEKVNNQITSYLSRGDDKFAQAQGILLKKNKKWRLCQEAYDHYMNALKTYENNQGFATRLKHTRNDIELKVKNIKKYVPKRVIRKRKVVFRDKL